MNNFLKSLSALSFGLDDGLASVRPRLPSLYEKPRTNWGESQDHVAMETQEVNPGSLDPPPYATRQPKSQRDVDGAINPQRSFDANAGNPSTPEPSATQRATSPVSKQSSIAHSEAVILFHPASDSSARQTARVNAEVPNSGHLLEKKPDSVAMFKPSIPTPKLDYLTEDRQAFPEKQAWPDSPRPQPIGLIADTGTLERRPMEKPLSQPEPDFGIPARAGQSVTKQKTNDPPFSVLRPNLQPQGVGMDNKAASAGPGPAPTIQVTIGRIEIRATPPAPVTPKNQDKKTSAMSLEEYLNKRNGGAR